MLLWITYIYTNIMGYKANYPCGSFRLGKGLRRGSTWNAKTSKYFSEGNLKDLHSADRWFTPLTATGFGQPHPNRTQYTWIKPFKTYPHVNTRWTFNRVWPFPKPKSKRARAYQPLSTSQPSFATCSCSVSAAQACAPPSGDLGTRERRWNS